MDPGGENRQVWVVVVSGCPPETGNISCSLFYNRLGEERVVPHSVVGPLWFLVYLFVRVRARPRYRTADVCVLLGVADDVDACMDGPAFDGTRVAPGSLVQSFTEYHDNSCARLTALQNSRVGCGPQGRRGTKRATTGSLRQVRLSAGKRRSFTQQQSRKLRGEMWASYLINRVR